MKRSIDLFSCSFRYASTSVSRSSFATCDISEVPLLLLLLHRTAGVVVDHAALALRRGGEQHLLDDPMEVLGVALDRARERIAPEGAEAHAPQLRRLAGLEPHSVVVDQDRRAVALDDR